MDIDEDIIMDTGREIEMDIDMDIDMVDVDTLIQGPGEELSGPNIISIPVEMLEKCFNFIVRYDTGDPGPILRRTQESTQHLAAVALVCKRFNIVVSRILYRELVSLLNPETDKSTHQLDLIYRTLFEKPQDAELVRSVNFADRELAITHSTPPRKLVWKVLCLVQNNLTQARLSSFELRIPESWLRRLNLHSLEHLFLQGGAKNPAVSRNYLGVAQRLAPNIRTLVVERFRISPGVHIQFPLNRLVSFTVLRSYFERMNVGQVTGANESIFPPLTHVLSKVPNLETFRLDPEGAAYYSELAADTAPWERMEYRGRYANISSLSVPPPTFDHRPSVFYDDHWHNIHHNKPTGKDQPPWDFDDEQQGTHKPGHAGLWVLDVLRMSPCALTALKRIHLGDPRQTTTTDERYVYGPMANLPKVEFVSIHCANLSLERWVSDYGARDLLEEIFTSCPRLEHLEITGLEQYLYRTGPTIVRILKEICHRAHMNPTWSLKKVSLCSEESHFFCWSLKRFNYPQFLDQFVGTGIEVEFIRRVG